MKYLQAPCRLVTQHNFHIYYALNVFNSIATETLTICDIEFLRNEMHITVA